jgi:hypothetical protein
MVRKVERPTAGAVEDSPVHSYHAEVAATSTGGGLFGALASSGGGGSFGAV